MRDNLGGQPAFQTADGLPSYSADITFTLTSPDYAPLTVNNLELAAGNNTWTFSSTAGGLTFPDSTVQTTAWTGTTAVTTVSTGGVVNATLAQEILLCDPNAAGANVNILLPASPYEGKIYTVKNINAGSYVVYVQPDIAHSIETETGTVGTEIFATLTNTGATMTWVYSNGVWRAINRFGV